MKVDSYTIDFALFPNLDKIFVIEINELPPIAGTGLFKFDSPIDRKIIEEGPFELRINEIPLENPLKDIQPSLRRYMRKLRGLEILEEEEDRLSIICDGCKRCPITKTWYRCTSCINYDLCTQCYEVRTKKHVKTHQFVQVGDKAQSSLSCSMM